MGYYKLDEIAAIRDSEGNITCLGCATDEQMNQLTSDEIIEKRS